MGDTLILCYHAISSRWQAPLAIAPDTFKAHLRILAARGYSSVTMTEAILGPAIPKAVAITFDDAYKSVFELAGPILTEAGFTASVLAPTAMIGSGEPMSWPGIERWHVTEHRDELMPMDWEDLCELADAGWEVGSHTCTHPHLPDLEPAALDTELERSRAEITERLGAPCNSLAYPYGAYDQKVIAAARRAGYRTACGTSSGGLRPPTGPLDWPRMVINREDNRSRFSIKISRRARQTMASSVWRQLARNRRRRHE